MKIKNKFQIGDTVRTTVPIDLEPQLDTMSAQIVEFEITFIRVEFSKFDTMIWYMGTTELTTDVYPVPMTFFVTAGESICEAVR